MKNKLYIFPTDTVYGIGAKLYDKSAIDEIYNIKGRDFNKPISVLCSNIEQIKEFAIMTNDALIIANNFWPGALTIILKTNDKYYSITKEETIGVRIPNHKKALKLINELGPLKTTSINKSGEEPLNDYNSIYERYNKENIHIYKNDEEISKVSSTVIDLTNNLKVIREGDIKLNDILGVLNSHKK